MTGWLLGVLVVAAVAALALWLVLGAMRRTAERQQADLPPPADCPPAAAVRLHADGARYLGTTFAPSTVRRFSGYGLLGRNVVGLTLDVAALRVERPSGGPWCIPRADLRGAAAATHHAGKAVGRPRVLVVDWMLGGTGLRSGFVLDEAAVPGWVAELNALVPR